MVNPENRPTKHLVTFRDGTQRMLCTNKGLKDTPKERKLKSQHMRGVPKKRETVEGWSKVWNVVKLLYARGALRVDVIEITGLKKSQVDNAIANNDRRPEWNRVTPFMILGESSAITRARRRRELRKNGISGDEAKSIQFARLLLGKGFIEEDISGWEELHAIYKQRGRELPREFSDKLSLEVFLKAGRRADKGGRTWLDQYTKIGLDIGSEWFDKLNDDRRFIRSIISGKGLNGNGHNNGFNSDGSTIWQAFRTLRQMGVRFEKV